MKAPILLKTILDICFFFLIISFSSALIITFAAVISGDSIIPIALNDTLLPELGPAAFTLLLIELIIAGLTVYTIFILRKLIRTFFTGKFFTQYQIRSLKRIGQLIILITLGQGITALASQILLETDLQLRIGMELSFTSFWFILAIGLFFVYLSRLFDNARILKEENDLTV